jgi:hypothetical protein
MTVEAVIFAVGVLFHLQPELADPRPPFALFAVDVGGILFGRRGQYVAAVCRNGFGGAG